MKKIELVDKAVEKKNFEKEEKKLKEKNQNFKFWFYNLGLKS